MKQPLIIRMGGLRAVARLGALLLLSVVLIASLPIMALWPFGRSHQPAVEIHDEAGIFYAETLTRDLEALRFREDVRVAVVSLPGDDIENLNDAVLEYARSQPGQPWISADRPDKWADGLIILAVAPDSRWIGCYFGEDIDPPLGRQQDIQNAAKPQLRRADWSGAMVTMGEDLADLIGRPGDGDPGLSHVLPGIAAITGIVLLIGTLWVGLSARRLATAARRSYAQVTHDYETTELLAGTIPSDESHGAQVLERYRWFQQEYAHVTRGFLELGSPVGAQWFSHALRRRAKDLSKRAAYLDTLDDVIVNASALLTLSSTWQSAWANEQGPVLEDLQSLERLCNQVDNRATGVDTSKDREWVRGQKRQLDTMTTRLGAHQISPSHALDELDRIADETRSRAGQLTRAALDADTSPHAEERRRRYENSQNFGRVAVYTGNWSLGGGHGGYNPHSTIRLNPSSPASGAVTSGGGGFSGAGSASSFAPISDLVVGYSSASSYTPASSSGSSSFSGSSFSGGGGFSGGGFSGAGSSSRF